MLKRSLSAASMIILLAALGPDCPAQEKELYFRVGLGAGKPLLSELSSELERQGNEMPLPGYVMGITLGKVFMDGAFNIEAAFSYSLVPDIRYKNDYEDFTETLSHYDFALVARKQLGKGGGTLVPSLGAGLGYGRSNLVEGGGRLESFEIIGSALLEYRIKETIYLFTEALYVGSFNRERFDAPYIENIGGDVLFDSDGNPLEDRYSVFELRAGVTFWLKGIDRYY